MFQWLASINYASPDKPLSTRDLTIFLITFFNYVSTILKFSISNKNGGNQTNCRTKLWINFTRNLFVYKKHQLQKVLKIASTIQRHHKNGGFNKTLRSVGFKMVDFQAFMRGLKIYKNLDEVSRLKFFRSVI